MLQNLQMKPNLIFLAATLLLASRFPDDPQDNLDSNQLKCSITRYKTSSKRLCIWTTLKQCNEFAQRLMSRAVNQITSIDFITANLCVYNQNLRLLQLHTIRELFHNADRILCRSFRHRFHGKPGLKFHRHSLQVK